MWIALLVGLVSPQPAADCPEVEVRLILSLESEERNHPCFRWNGSPIKLSLTTLEPKEYPLRYGRGVDASMVRTFLKLKAAHPAMLLTVNANFDGQRVLIENISLRAGEAEQCGC